MLDWINALAAQDSSFESQLAQRDLTKKLALLQNTKQDQASNEMRQREFDARMAETQATHAETQRQREVTEADRKTAEKRNRYNTVHDNLKPGDRMKRGPDFDLMNEFGTGTQFTPATDDPDALIYQEKAWKQAQLDHETAVATKAAAEKRAAEDQKMQQHQQKIADQDAANRQKAADRAAKAFEAKTKLADAIAEKLSSAGKAEAQQSAKAMLDATEKSGGFFGSDEEVAQKRAQIVHDAYDEVLKKEQARSGRGANPSTLIKGPESGEHRYWRLGGMVGPEPK